MSVILIFILFAVALAGYAYMQFCKASREIDRLYQAVSRLESENAKQAAEIQRKNAEVKNAKIQQKHTENVRRVSTDTVDEQLHQHGWFRDTDHHHGLHGVSADLSKPSRHSGDQAADTGAQSDSSGDL